jgi:hypothetical protein
MANEPTLFPETEVEIAPLAMDLKLVFSAGFYEDDEASTPTTNIVYSEETYYVKLDWKLEGLLAHHFCGVWQVKVDLESIGTADEYTSELYKIDMDPCQKEGYSHTFEITPDTVHPAEGGTVYLVAVTLSSLDPCGQPGHIWAYGTGVSVMFVPGKAP